MSESLSRLPKQYVKANAGFLANRMAGPPPDSHQFRKQTLVNSIVIDERVNRSKWKIVLFTDGSLAQVLTRRFRIGFE